MSIVTTHVTIGNQPLLRIMGIFPGQVDHGREGVFDITCRAQVPSNDVVVRRILPLLEWMPEIGAVLGSHAVFQHTAQRCPVNNLLQDIHNERGGSRHTRSAMSQRQVLLSTCRSFARFHSVMRDDGNHPHQSANVLFQNPALARGNPAGQAGEKMAVILLRIGVPMTPRSSHEGDVALEIIIGIVLTAVAQGFHQQAGTLEIEGVLAGPQKLVVMNAALPPERALVMEDIKTFSRRSELRTP